MPDVAVSKLGAADPPEPPPPEPPPHEPPPHEAPPDDPDIRIDRTIRDALTDANALLRYAAEAGVDTVQGTAEAILEATASVRQGTCTQAQIVAFYAAYTRLADRLSPVTGDSIRACGSPEVARTLARNRFWAIVLTAVIVVLSIATFVDTSISSKIASDITDNNAAAAKLRGLLTPSGTVTAADACGAIHQQGTGRTVGGIDDVTQVQQFAAGLRDVYGKALKLNYFVAKMEVDPLRAVADPSGGVPLRDRLQLNPALINYEAEVFCKISTYEEVRSFAQNILLDNSVAFGALAAYVLPVAYALLGAMAFRLRTFADTIRKRTFHPSYADSARLIAAVIAGAIVSLFNIFTQGITLSPLALAFLIGYGVEIFFTFLDTILNSFGSGGTARRPVPAKQPA